MRSSLTSSATRERSLTFFCPSVVHRPIASSSGTCYQSRIPPQAHRIPYLSRKNRQSSKALYSSSPVALMMPFIEPRTGSRRYSCIAWWRSTNWTDTNLGSRKFVRSGFTKNLSTPFFSLATVLPSTQSWRDERLPMGLATQRQVVYGISSTFVIESARRIRNMPALDANCWIRPI